MKRIFKLKQKTKSKKGITVFELLVSITIMAFVFTLAAGAISVASQCYRNVTSKVEAQVFLTENINAITKTLRYIDNNCPFTIEEGTELLKPENDKITTAEIPGQKIVFTSIGEEFEGYFENAKVKDAQGKDKGTLICFRSTIDGENGKPARKYMALNDDKHAPLSSKIVFYEGTSKKQIIFKVTIFDGEKIAAHAKVTVYPTEKIIEY